MHYCVLAIFDEPKTVDTVKEAVEELLAPYCDIRWDWYQIGGRWTGLFDGYDPDKDPNNLVGCEYCGGTGKRTDIEVANGCNACEGTGKRLKWPTGWAVRAGDILPVDKLTGEHLDVHDVCCEGYGWFASEDYVPWANGDAKFTREELPPLDWLKKTYPNGVAVVVDCHS